MIMKWVPFICRIGDIDKTDWFSLLRTIVNVSLDDNFFPLISHLNGSSASANSPANEHVRFILTPTDALRTSDSGFKMTSEVGDGVRERERGRRDRRAESEAKNMTSHNYTQKLIK